MKTLDETKCPCGSQSSSGGNAAMRGRNTTIASARIPDQLWAMVKADAVFSDKTVSELIKEIIAHHYEYKHEETREVIDAQDARNA